MNLCPSLTSTGVLGIVRPNPRYHLDTTTCKVGTDPVGMAPQEPNCSSYSSSSCSIAKVRNQGGCGTNTSYLSLGKEHAWNSRLRRGCEARTHSYTLSMSEKSEFLTANLAHCLHHLLSPACPTKLGDALSGVSRSVCRIGVSVSRLERPLAGQ